MKLKDNLNGLGNTKKSTKPFLFLQKRKLEKLIKKVMKLLKLYFTKQNLLIENLFMVSLLSNLVDNSAEEIHKVKCKNCGCFLEYESVKDNLIKYKCFSCNKDYSNKLDEELKKKFNNAFKFSNNYINKFILLLRKDIYPYEYMDPWEKFNETALPEKEEF